MRMTRCTILLVVALGCPGCLAAAVAGGAYIIAKNKEAKTETAKARLDYLTRRRAAGATDAQILAEIRATDPEWYADILEAGGKLEVAE